MRMTRLPHCSGGFSAQFVSRGPHSRAATPKFTTTYGDKRTMKKLFATAALTLAAFTIVPATVASASDMKADIVDTAVEAGAFNTLVAAVQAAGLVETLKSDGPFTVFAPSDEAFAALPEGTLEALLAEDGLATLTSILTYHVVPGKVMSTDILGQKLEATTAAGIPVAIDATMGSVMVGGAKVITADIETSNGVIHVIDAVILPPAAN